MFSFKFNSNSAKVNRKMSDLVARQMPFATAKTLTLTAKTLVEQNKRDMPKLFNNPVPWTQNAFFFIPAQKNTLRAVVKRKDKGQGSNVSPARQNYLETQNEGGGRSPKAFENALRGKSPNAARFRYATPTRNTRMTAAGNMSRASIAKMLGQVGSPGAKMFVPKSTHPLAKRGGDGVYERMAKGRVLKRLHLTNSIPSYQPAFRFEERMNNYARKAYSRILRRELQAAMRTARLR
jgi:hypothetical protein